MDILSQLKSELESEYEITKQFFELYPTDKDDYAPHLKSMKMKRLVTHILDIFRWPDLIFNSDKLDFVTDNYASQEFTSKEDLMDLLEKNYKAGVIAIEQAKDEDLDLSWHIAHNGQKLMEWNKYGAIRHGLNQITHHRAQLGVYYRLNDIVLPSSYGPSADTMK